MELPLQLIHALLLSNVILSQHNSTFIVSVSIHGCAYSTFLLELPLVFLGDVTSLDELEKKIRNRKSLKESNSFY